MNTASIKIGDTYALQTVKGRPSGDVTDGPKIVRFHVFSIIANTVKTARKPKGETTNRIKGIIAEADAPGRSQEQRTLEVGPEDLLSNYTAYEELKTKQESEERAHKERVALQEATDAALQDKLYAFTGIHQPQPGEPGYSKYSEPIKVSYGGGVTISKEASAKFMEALEKIQVPA